MRLIIRRYLTYLSEIIRIKKFSVSVFSHKQKFKPCKHNTYKCLYI